MAPMWQILLILIIKTNVAFAQLPTDRETATFEQQLSDISIFSPAVVPVSAGSYGATVGILEHSYTFEDSSPYLSKHLGVDDSRKLHIQKLTWHKGTPWPVDFGVALGSDRAHTFTDWHLYTQWTLFERLRWPSLSARGFYRQLYNFDSVTVMNFGGEVAASYSFLRYFSVFTAVGWHQTSMNFRHVTRDPEVGLVTVSSVPQLSTTTNHNHARLGIAVTPYFHFIKIVAEDIVSNTQSNPTYQITIGY